MDPAEYLRWSKKRSARGGVSPDPLTHGPKIEGDHFIGGLPPPPHLAGGNDSEFTVKTYGNDSEFTVKTKNPPFFIMLHDIKQAICVIKNLKIGLFSYSSKLLFAQKRNEHSRVISSVLKAS
jgi:hypothetical protein